jgi:hypothetical protein
MDFHLRKITKTKLMGNLLYINALVLTVLWAFGYFIFNIGSIIHILPVIVLISLLIRFIKNRNVLINQSEVITIDSSTFEAADIFVK